MTVERKEKKNDFLFFFFYIKMSSYINIFEKTKWALWRSKFEQNLVNWNANSGPRSGSNYKPRPKEKWSLFI